MEVQIGLNYLNKGLLTKACRLETLLKMCRQRSSHAS